jgi:hypothetical protein
LLIFANDHFNTFFLNNSPLFAIGAAPSTAGPNDQTPMPRYELEVAEQLASHIYAAGVSNRFDLALTQEFEVDHAFAVPVHFLAPHGKLPILPIFINCFATPLPLSERAYEFGQMVGDAIRAYEGGLRVAIMGSGSFSLEIGGPQIAPNERIGVPDPAWAARIVDHMQANRVKDLIVEATPLQLARAGNAGGELLNWIAMLGAVGDRAPSFLRPRRPHAHAFGLWSWSET